MGTPSGSHAQLLQIAPNGSGQSSVGHQLTLQRLFLGRSLL